jgi:hypothetical protein
MHERKDDEERACLDFCLVFQIRFASQVLKNFEP